MHGGSITSNAAIPTVIDVIIDEPPEAPLYVLAKADDITLRNAIKDGVITPDMPRKAVAALLPAKAKREARQVSTNPACNRSTHLVNSICYNAEFFLKPVATMDPDKDMDIDGLPDEAVEALESVVCGRIDPIRIPDWARTLRKVADDLRRFATRLEQEAEQGRA